MKEHIDAAAGKPGSNEMFKPYGANARSEAGRTKNAAHSHEVRHRACGDRSPAALAAEGRDHIRERTGREGEVALDQGHIAAAGPLELGEGEVPPLLLEATT